MSGDVGEKIVGGRHAQRQTMSAAGRSRQRHDACEAGRKIRLSACVCAPDRHCSRIGKGEAVRSARADGDHIGQARRHVRLAASVQSPRDHSSVRTQGQSMIEAGGDGHDLGKIGRSAALAEGVTAPRRHGAVRFQGEHEIIAGGDRHHVAQPGRYRPRRAAPNPHQTIAHYANVEIEAGGDGHQIRHRRTGGQVQTPALDAAIGFQREAVRRAARQRDHVAQSSRDVDLAVGVEAPRCDGAIGLQGQAVIGTARDGREPTQSGRSIQLPLVIGAPASQQTASGELVHGTATHPQLIAGHQSETRRWDRVQAGETRLDAHDLRATARGLRRRSQIEAAVRAPLEPCHGGQAVWYHHAGDCGGAGADWAGYLRKRPRKALRLGWRGSQPNQPYYSEANWGGVLVSRHVRRG